MKLLNSVLFSLSLAADPQSDWDINPPAQQTDLLQGIAERGSRPDFSESGDINADKLVKNSGETAKEKYYGDDKDYADLLHPYSSGLADTDVKG